MNLGNAHAPNFADPSAPPIQITMDGKHASGLLWEIKTDVSVLMHFES